MSNIIVTDNGKIRNVDDIEWAERIIKLKNSKDKWVVIEELIKHWSAIAGDEEQAIGINVTQYREQIKDKKFGTTDLGKEQDRRFKLAFPYRLHQMIKAVYKNDIQFDEDFFAEFGRRYPAFKVAEQ